MGKLLWMEGFGKYGTSFSSSVSGGRYNTITAGGVASTVFASGAKGIRFATETDKLEAILSSASGSTVVIGFRLKMGTGSITSEGKSFISLKSTAGTAFGMIGCNQGQILGYNASSVFTFGPGTPMLSDHTLADGVEVFIEVKLLLSTGSTIGTANFWVNGATAGAVTGRTVATASAAVCKRIQLGATDQSANAGGRIVDESVLGDVYVTDSSVLGDVTITYYATNTDSTETGENAWTPSSGTNHAALLDETPPDGDTTHVSAGSGTPLDRFSMATVSTGVSYKAVQQVGYAKKVAAGAGGYRFSNILSTDSTVSAGFSPATSYGYNAKIFETNPAGNAWTRTGVNNTRWGIQRTT